MRGLAARQAALDALVAVLGHHRPLETALETALAAQGSLDPRDAHFARAIASETLRRMGQLEDLVRHFVSKPVPRHRSGPTLEILLLSACELVFLDVPPHAAVDAANRLAANDIKARHFKPLINAVLHHIATEGKALAAAQDIRLDVPDALWTRWCGTYGDETARRIAEAHLHPAPLDIVAPGGTPPPGAAPLFGAVYRMPAQRVDTLSGFAEGAWWVQDAAATLPARLLGDVRGKRVLDLCAAPGGKTAELAAAGALVTAVEREETRLARLKENLARLHLSAETVCADVCDFDGEPAPFVLIDAPCSATGTVRRHPELPWIKGAADIVMCAQAAAEILDAAARATAPGGTLVFAVCSLEHEEGPEQAEDFLVSHSDFAPVPIQPSEVFGHAEWLSGGNLRTLPCHLAEAGGMDGFFAARFRRR